MSSYHWLHVSKGQAILLQWCGLSSSGDISTVSSDCSTIRTASNRIKIMWHKIVFHPKLTTDTCIQYERWEPQIYDLPRYLPKEKWEVKIFLLVLALMWFLWNNLWSVSRYTMGPFSGWWRHSGNGQHYLAAPIWIYRSGIGDHRFKFFTNFLPNYTFYTNLSILLIVYLLIEDVTCLMTFNWWTVQKITQRRFMPV